MVCCNESNNLTVVHFFINKSYFYMKNFNLQIIITMMLTVVFLTESVAQNREIGLTLNGANNFGLVYKKQKAENKYINYQFAYFNGEFAYSENRVRLGLNIGLSAAFEKRKSINENFVFARGLVVGMGVLGNHTEFRNNNNSISSSALRLSPRIGYLLGGQYHISDKFYVGLDVIPSFIASVDMDRDQPTEYNISTNFNMDAVTLNFVYKFSNEKS